MILASSCDSLWIFLGDFNVIFNSLEVFGGSQGLDKGAKEFTNHVYSTCLEDLRYIGF